MSPTTLLCVCCLVYAYLASSVSFRLLTNSYIAALYARDSQENCKNVPNFFHILLKKNNKIDKVK